MGGVGRAVKSVWNTLADAAPDLMPQPAPVSVAAPDLAPMNTLISEQTAAIKKAEDEQTKLAADLAKAQELSAKRSEELKVAFEAANAPVAEPKSMPSPTSGEVRQAKRKAVATMQRRGGRQSTILSDQDFLGG